MKNKAVLIIFQFAKSSL